MDFLRLNLERSMYLVIIEWSNKINGFAKIKGFIEL